MHTRFVLVLATLSMVIAPAATAIPGGSGVLLDQGVTTSAHAKAEITAVIYDAGDPNTSGDETCEIEWMEYGDVAGYFTLPYEWSIPGDGGDEIGPVYEQNQIFHTETVDAGNTFGPEETTSWIEIGEGPVESLDEAEASDETGWVTCEEGASASDVTKCLQEKQDIKIPEDLTDFGSCV